MLTPQEVANKEFVKAVFGGYDMAAVDDFLETLTADYTALYKENAILKSKIKVLVEKVEEYRSTDEAMRMALLTAQRLGDEIKNEAKKKSEEMLAQAEAEIRSRLGEMKAKLAEEEEKLRRAKEETRRFVQASQEILRQHASFLERLESLGLETKEEEPAEEAAETPPEAQQPETETAAAEEEPANPDDPFGMHSAPAEEDPFDRIFRDEETVRFIRKRLNGGDSEEQDSTKPRFDFSDLKFGKNYKGE